MVAALVTVTASTSALLRPALTPQEFALARDVPTVSPSDPGDQPRGLHVFLVPHPDDELSAWTSLLEGADLYPVIVLLTQGEATQRCAAESMAKHLNAGLGEIPPEPDPSEEGAASPTCKEARLNSFRQAVSAAAEHTPLMTLDWSKARDAELAGQPVQFVPGPAATLLLLDLGDSTLTADGVEEATLGLLESPDAGLPDLPLIRITSAAYYATEASSAGAGCDSLALCPPGEEAYVYDHPDHLAVREAARSLAPRAREGSWLVTHASDPAATRHLALSQDLYEEFMALGPGDPWSAQRVGSYQRIYGWLAFPDVWRPGDLPVRSTEVMFPRVQSYEVVTP